MGWELLLLTASPGHKYVLPPTATYYENTSIVFWQYNGHILALEPAQNHVCVRQHLRASFQQTEKIEYKNTSRSDRLQGTN